MDQILLRRFRRAIRRFYAANRRDFPWRNTRNPYRILVSEIMLQQTQAPRVVPKYSAFIKAFPSFRSLANAPLREVLSLWQGLGYNRRALALKRLAETVVSEYKGRLPRDMAKLIKLPGIGPYTAAAVAAFAFDVSAVFIETNIRSVFIHFFFPERTDVADREILPFIEAALDRKNPRDWYYALMDYGAMLKQSGQNPSRRSVRHAKQSAFEGSRRQLRGRIIRVVIERQPVPVASVAALAGADPAVTKEILEDLEREGFIYRDRGKLRIRD
jgi:A/G-specific adenine glycosylase